MCKVININDYQRKNNILRTKREDIITIYELMRSNNERLNRFTGTVAAKNKNQIKYPLSEYDLGLLKTKAGIFYRDENLTALNEAILARRNEDVKNSTRMSTSKYRKTIVKNFDLT